MKASEIPDALKICRGDTRPRRYYVLRYLRDCIAERDATAMFKLRNACPARRLHEYEKTMRLCHEIERALGPLSDDGLIIIAVSMGFDACSLRDWPAETTEENR